MVCRETDVALIYECRMFCHTCKNAEVRAASLEEKVQALEDELLKSRQKEKSVQDELTRTLHLLDEKLSDLTSLRQGLARLGH